MRRIVALFIKSISHSYSMWSRIQISLFSLFLLVGCFGANQPEQKLVPTQGVEIPKKVLALGVRGDIPITVWSDGKVFEGKKRKEIFNFDARIILAALSRDGEMIAGVTSDDIFVASLDGSFIKKYNAPKTRMSSLAFDSGKQSVYFAGVDSRVYRWKFLAENTVKRPSFERYAGHGSVVSAVCADLNSPVFFSSDWAGTLSAWLPYDADRFSGSFDKNIFGSTIFQEVEKIRVNANRMGDDSPYDFLAASEGIIFAASQNGVLDQWQIRGFKKTWMVQAHIGSLVSLDSDLKGFVVSAGRDGTVRAWNGATIGQISLLNERALIGAEHVAVGESKFFVSLKDGTIEEFQK